MESKIYPNCYDLQASPAHSCIGAKQGMGKVVRATFAETIPEWGWVNQVDTAFYDSFSTPSIDHYNYAIFDTVAPIMLLT